MKLVGIVGSVFENSLNRKLLEFAKFKFSDLVDIEILDISNIPLFSQDLDINDYPKILEISKKIEDSSGVIIATPEHNYTVPTVLKSLLEWLSYSVHPFQEKPVMIIGSSYTDQGSSRAQLHLKQILDSPGMDAFIMPGNEFLLGKAKDKFDENGYINDIKTIDFLEHSLLKFLRFAKTLDKLDLRNIDSTFSKTMKAGGYPISDDPYDGTAGASEY